MTIDPHRQPWHFPPLEFAGVPITEESHLKRLGVTFDCQFSYRRQLRADAVRASQRLGLLSLSSPRPSQPSNSLLWVCASGNGVLSTSLDGLG